MKVEELRIGNWVKTCTPDMPIMIPYVEAQVQAITIFHELEFFHTPLLQGLTMAVRHTMGIPLTPEWLEKFGLVKGQNYPGWVLLKDPELGDYVKDNLIWQFPWGWGYDHIKHVHQLQNLYFALTGEELKIKSQPILGNNK